VPPQSSRSQSPNETSRTVSPYFSSHMPIPPLAIARASATVSTPRPSMLLLQSFRLRDTPYVFTVLMGTYLNGSIEAEH